MLLEYAVHHAPGGQTAGRQNQTIGRDIFNLDIVVVSQIVPQRQDQCGLVRINRLIVDVRRHIEHGANCKIDFIVADHGQAITARNVSELNVDVGVTFTKVLHEAWQQVDDG